MPAPPAPGLGGGRQGCGVVRGVARIWNRIDGLGGFAALKIAGAGMPAAMAALIGMLLMPPRSSREFVARTACTVVSSFLFGPLLAIGMIAWMPDIVSSAYWLAQRTGLGEDGLLAMFYVLGPCMLAGLPAWWVLGAYLRLTAKLQNQDLVDWAVEIRRKALGLGQGIRRKEEIMTLEQVMRDAIRPRWPCYRPPWTRRRRAACCWRSACRKAVSCIGGRSVVRRALLAV